VHPEQDASLIYSDWKHPMPRLDQLLESLEAFYGEQLTSWPTDPYLFLLWWHCGYPASDASCAKGW